LLALKENSVDQSLSLKATATQNMDNNIGAAP
jgi:hypothetical protein